MKFSESEPVQKFRHPELVPEMKTRQNRPQGGGMGMTDALRKDPVDYALIVIPRRCLWPGNGRRFLKLHRRPYEVKIAHITIVQVGYWHYKRPGKVRPLQRNGL